MPRRDQATIDPVDQELLENTIDIEADTVEEAMARVATDLGDDAEILDARKVARGGLGGFFAKERVVITARKRQNAGVAGVIDRIAESEEAAGARFGDLLRKELEDHRDGLGIEAFLDAAGWTDEESAAAVHEALEGEPAAVTVGPEATSITIADGAGHTLEITPDPGVEPARPLPADTPAWRIQESAGLAEGMGAVDWGMKELVRYGIPGPIVSAVSMLDVRDDLGWINGIADAVAPLCDSLPDNDMVIVGPDAELLAGPLDLPVILPGQMAPYEGSFCTQLLGGHEDRKWLDFVLGARSLHLVIGDDPRWRDLLVADPKVVSWVGDRSVVDALYVATTLDAKLGYGSAPGTVDRLVRARPVDIALAVRGLIGRR